MEHVIEEPTPPVDMGDVSSDIILDLDEDFMLYSLGLENDIEMSYPLDSEDLKKTPEVKERSQSKKVKPIKSKTRNSKKVSQKKRKSKRTKRTFNWKKEAFKFVVTHTENNNTFESDDDTSPTPTPINYFLQLFSMIAFKLITDQTNLYSCQRTGKSIDTNIFEIQNFVGMLIMMGIICLPAWSSRVRTPPNAERDAKMNRLMLAHIYRFPRVE